MKPAEKNTTYRICDRVIESYYYKIPYNIKNKTELEKFSPYKKHIVPITKYEGEYHPTCKINIEGYENYSISENQILFISNKISNNSILII